MVTVDALHERSRKKARRKFFLEAGILVGVTAVGILAVYLIYGRSTTESPWRVAGTNVQDVSRSDGIQTEVAVAADPSDPGILFGPATCAWGDPAVAIAPDGRQYVAFTEKVNCAPGASLTPYLVVASRPEADRKWTGRRVARPVGEFGFDDKPAIAVGRDGRAYVAWSRRLGAAYQTTVVSSSADGGRTWSSPQIVDRRLVQPQLVTVA